MQTTANDAMQRNEELENELAIASSYLDCSILDSLILCVRYESTLRVTRLFNRVCALSLA